MEITGKLVQILPEETGESKNGPWKKQSFIIETQEQYPKKVCITVWGDKVDLKSFSLDQDITAGINIASREFNGKWYTDVTAWRLTNASGTSAPPQQIEKIPEELEPLHNSESDTTDDLPF